MNSLSSNDIPISADQRGSTTGGGNENKQECASCEQKNGDYVGASCELLNDMSISDNNIAADSISTCANCGKEGSGVTNTCNKCKSVMYCNAACKKKHRHKHKKDCEEHLRLAADRAAELHDEALFKQPPPVEDCPICFLRMPLLGTGNTYQLCCGKVICSGCFHANAKIDDNKHKQLCAFCRIPAPTSGEEVVKRLNKRVDVKDAEAMFNLGCEYRDGKYGFARDYAKALELYQRAGELGFTKSYCSIGYAYSNGRGVEVDKKKAQHYYELAAMGGNVSARHNLGNVEYRLGNMDRALKHWTIAANDGCDRSLQNIQMFYSKGHATKDVYTVALQSYQKYLFEIKSVQRDEAAIYSEDFKYY